MFGHEDAKYLVCERLTERADAIAIDNDPVVVLCNTINNQDALPHP